MKNLGIHFYVFFAHLGGVGIFVLGALDSSFLFVPFGNDLLMIAMTARKHILMPYYAFAAALGSLIGCYTIDLVSRKGGEKSLEKYLSHRRYEYVTRHIKRNAAWALALAALMPPPFPFTPFVAAASALQYPRKKLLAVIGITRVIRFSIEGTLAIFMGKRILLLARSKTVEGGIAILVVVSVLGSVISVYHWFTAGGLPRSRKSTKRASV